MKKINENIPKNSEVIFKYYLPDNEIELLLHTNSRKMFNLLWTIDHYCRSISKHELDPSQDRLELAEKIRDMIWDEMDLDEMNE